MTENYKELADRIVSRSLSIDKNGIVFIDAFDKVPNDFLEILIEKIFKVGAVPYISIKDRRILRVIFEESDRDTMETYGDIESYAMEQADYYIGIKAPNNVNEHHNISREAWDIYDKYWWKPVHLDTRLPKTDWITLRWPTSAMAQKAGMSTSEFENVYFKSCLFNIDKVEDAIHALVEYIKRTDEVRIKSPQTDLRFKLGDFPVITADGGRNLPPGEVFTAPERRSVSGRIKFNSPTIYRGTDFRDVELKFRDGRVVEATASNGDKFREILDIDKGARYVGEFALAFNPHIRKPITDILFDEKIAGSLHIALGNAYQRADNGNRSNIHWDLVLIQREDWGGGGIFFDGKLIRKDGKFVPEDLKKLNSEQILEG